MANEQPRKVDIGAPLSVDIIYQLINSSIQSDKPLWLVAVNLSGAVLYHAQLSGADLRMANLQGASLDGANLSDADLRSADLSGAKLWDANLSDANLQGANLTEAQLWGANLSDADLFLANLTGAKYGDDTTWPDGFDPETAGAVLAAEAVLAEN